MATQLYGTMCTDIGNAAIANSVLCGPKVNFTQIAVGDANGTPYVPVSGQTTLKHQVWSGAIAEVSADPEQPNRMILHAVLPSSVGGWVMREIGVLDDKGRLIAIGNTPEIPKEVVTSGAIMEMDLYIYISVVDARGVNVVIDPTVVIATKADINKLWQAVDAMKSAVSTATLLASSWTGTAAPYSITVSLPGAKPEPTRIEVQPSPDATADQWAAWRAALIRGGGQTTDKITLLADGDKPEINIPITVTVRGDVQ